ncbi:hypothetical protein [Flavivirga eckloniae]|nr:hypothetical protein [Flavivirga eckloniae]
MYVDINVTIVDSVVNKSPLMLLPLPFKLTDMYSFESANDVKVSILSKGQNYTILSVISPNNHPAKFSIINGYELGVTQEGKSEFEFNTSFPFITNPERELFERPITIDTINIAITFPQEFDDKEIGMSDFLFEKVSKQTYQTKHLKLHDKESNEEWIVFPNPFKSKIDIYKLIFALIAGFITLIIHLKAIRKKNIIWALSIFILSSILVGLFIYFIITIPKPLEIMIWTATAIPHAIFGLLASIYIFTASKLQCTLTGQVTIDARPAQIANIMLYKIESSGTRKMVAKKHQLDDSGRYTFSKWLKRGTHKFIVQANMDISDEVESSLMEISRGKRKEITPINLTSLEVK